MRRAARAAIVVAIAAALVVAHPPDARASDPTPDQAHRDLNAWRAQAGVPPVVSLRPDWNRGCALHNRYQRHAGGLTHHEAPGSPYYTDEGNDAAQNSVLSEGQLLPRPAWLHAVYHRTSLLQPRLRVSGFDASSGNTCMRVYGGIDDGPAARTPTLTLYPWPPNGATNQPTSFSGGEVPSPATDAGGAGPLGFLLSVNVNGPWQHSTSPSSDVVNASLRSDDGDRVGIGISDRDSPYGSTYLDGGFGLFPMAPLSFGTGYTAQAEGVVYAEGQSHPFSYRWRFSTQARPRGTVGDGRQSLRLRARTVRRGRPFRLVYLAAARGRISVSLTRRGRAYIRGTLNVRAGSGTVRVPAGRPGAYVLRAVLKTSVVTRLRQRVRVAG